jgi:hypothetical protein
VKTVGKVILAIVLACAGLIIASFVGGALAGVLGVMLQLNAKTVDSLGWTCPKVIFLGILIFLYLRSKRKKENTPERG